MIKYPILNHGIPICSMYGIFICIWVIYGVNVGKYYIHGASGIWFHQFLFWMRSPDEHVMLRWGITLQWSDTAIYC